MRHLSVANREPGACPHPSLDTLNQADLHPLADCHLPLPPRPVLLAVHSCVDRSESKGELSSARRALYRQLTLSSVSPSLDSAIRRSAPSASARSSISSTASARRRTTRPTTFSHYTPSPRLLQQQTTSSLLERLVDLPLILPCLVTLCMVATATRPLPVSTTSTRRHGASGKRSGLSSGAGSSTARGCTRSMLRAIATPASSLSRRRRSPATRISRLGSSNSSAARCVTHSACFTRSVRF